MPIKGPNTDATSVVEVESPFMDTIMMTHAKQNSIDTISTRDTFVPKAIPAIIVVINGFVEKITVYIVSGMKFKLARCAK